jgi:hypothetical protein
MVDEVIREAEEGKLSPMTDEEFFTSLTFLINTRYQKLSRYWSSDNAVSGPVYRLETTSDNRGDSSGLVIGQPAADYTVQSTRRSTS